jgi:hypothetical protein
VLTCTSEYVISVCTPRFTPAHPRCGAAPRDELALDEVEVHTRDREPRDAINLESPGFGQVSVFIGPMAQ